ncbi:TetR/AcrR family transcriptional regulator [Salininema proteolyticum]|uniref:TetR/AcrR family transcriptional regulator n=1 Tax=Salininema proteolyticum TaxID=1607685 RepID=A0ABV8TXJ1_9ACTN
MDNEENCAPSQGRPRSREASVSILTSALDLLAERGSLSAVSMEAIAERAGVSKATVYRRWSSKEELVAAAIDNVKAPVVDDLPHRTVREDLLITAAVMGKNHGPREEAVFHIVHAEMKGNEEMRRHHDRFMEARRAIVREIFTLGKERGELREDVDVNLAVAMFVSPIISIRAYKGFPELDDENLPVKVIDTLLEGMLTR